MRNFKITNSYCYLFLSKEFSIRCRSYKYCDRTWLKIDFPTSNRTVGEELVQGDTKLFILPSQCNILPKKHNKYVEEMLQQLDDYTEV